MEIPAIKVLLIDDEPAILDISKQFLELDHSISVDAAVSAIDAQKLIELSEYDVIVSDYQMPEKDGIQLLNEIRATGNNIPFIIFTGKGREEVAIEALNAGADFYLQKGGQSASQFAELANIIKQAYARKEGERKLRISEERYRSLFENSVDAVMLTTNDFESVLSANPSACKMFGMTEDEIKKIGIKGLIIDDKTWDNILGRLNQTGIVKGEFSYRRKDGVTFTGETTSGILTGHYGIARISMIVRDITDRKLSDEAIRDRETRFRTYVDSAPEGIFILDAKGNFQDVNRTACSLLKYSGEELLNLNIKNITEKGVARETLNGFNRLKKKGKLAMESVLIRKDGVCIPVFLNAVELPNKTYMAFCTDILERKRAVDALKESEEKYHNVFDWANDAIILHTLTTEAIPGHFIDVNKVACDMLGYSKEELLTMGPPDIVPTELHRQLVDIVRLANIKDTVLFETMLQRKDGTTVPVESSGRLMNYEGKKIRISHIRDITKRKHLEETLRGANHKLNLLSSITRHDIRNYLMALDGNLTLLSMKELDPASKELLRKSNSALNRISAIIQFTKEYQDLGVKDPVWHNVREMIEKEARGILLGPIKLANDVPTDLEIYADPLITKVFHNLIDNAVRHGNKITTIHFSFEEREGSHAIVSEDDGAGIPSEKKVELFTHDSRKKHGFGLFLSHEILAITGITIEEVGEPGHGAKFLMTVPSSGFRGFKTESE